jgi:hypothetical protein
LIEDPPLPGRCSRCGQPAVLDEHWWRHSATPCEAADLIAEFLPDPTGGADV